MVSLSSAMPVLALNGGELFQHQQQRVISLAAVALCFQRDIKLAHERQPRHRDSHACALVEGNTKIFFEVLDEKSGIEIALHHLRREIVQDPALSRTLGNRAQ